MRVQGPRILRHRVGGFDKVVHYLEHMLQQSESVSAPSDPQPDQEARRLGTAIRSARQGRFTVQHLAKAAGISAGLLSQIERGLGNPSYKTLHKIAGALELRIGDLVEAANPAPAAARVVRQSDRTRLQFGSEGLTYELLTPDLRGRLEVLQTSIPSGWTNEGNPFRHDGEECVVVLEGALTVDVDGTRDVLSAGDAITIDPTRPHWWHNHTPHPAVIIGAVTPPTF